MRKSECILVTDREMTADEILVEQVKLDERRVRADTLVAMLRTGTVYVMEDTDPTHIRVAVGENIFTDLRDDFPTTLLMANIALALDAGQGENTYELWCGKERDAVAASGYRISLTDFQNRRAMEVRELADYNFKHEARKIENDYRDGKKPKLDEYVKKGLRP